MFSHPLSLLSAALVANRFSAPLGRCFSKVEIQSITYQPLYRYGVGVFNRDQPWTGLGIVLFVFTLDFVLHIVFAAQGWDFLFSLVAIEIAIIVHAFGPLVVLIGGQRGEDDRVRAMKYGLMLALPLTIGYWWAVNDMSWSDWLVATILIPLAVHASLWNRHSWLASLFYAEKG